MVNFKEFLQIRWGLSMEFQNNTPSNNFPEGT
jgi:hypothetical protein